MKPIDIGRHRFIFVCAEALFMSFTLYCFIAGLYGFPSNAAIYLVILGIHFIFTIPVFTILIQIIKKNKAKKDITKTLLIAYYFFFVVYILSLILQTFLIISDIINPPHWAFG